MRPPKDFSPENIVRILVRRRWVILVPLALGVAMTPSIVRLVPEQYRSETLILVIPQRVPDSYVKSTITDTVADRLFSINDQILSRSRLERIITDLDLYRDERHRLVMEEVVGRMRGNIGVTLDTRSLNSFRVSYVSADPQTARMVTERLASLYIEQNLRDREAQAESTSQFIETQLVDAKRRLLEQEKKLEDYRRRHAGQLPSQLPGNLQTIQNAQQQLQAVNESMNRAKDRRLLVERQIADAQVVPPSGAQPPVAASASDAPTGGTLAQQIEATQARLETYKLRYTPDHPDVLALQRTIEELRARLEAEAPLSPSRIPDKTLTPLEIAREKRVRDLEAELDVIDRQLAAGQEEVERLKQTIREYQTKIDVVPTRESELVELTRDYSTLQTAYTSLLTKREDSKIAANLERLQIGEQFKILDHASLPERPFNQRQRLAMIFSGAIGGLGLGLLLTGFLEYRDSSFKREEDVLKVLSLPVLALVPRMSSDRERRIDRRRRLAVDAAGVAVLLATVVVLALWRLHS